MKGNRRERVELGEGGREGGWKGEGRRRGGGKVVQ